MYTNLVVAETSPIPVRMSREMISRLDDVAMRLGNTRAGIVKLCLAAFLSDFEKRGKASLPLDWEEVLAALDGRTLGNGGPRAGRREPSDSDGLSAVDTHVADVVERVHADVSKAREIAEPPRKAHKQSAPKPRERGGSNG